MTRTTLSIDDEILQAARALARERKQSIGKVLSDLARKGLQPSPTTRYRGTFPTFEVREGAKPITPAMVKAAMEDEELDR